MKQRLNVLWDIWKAVRPGLVAIVLALLIGFPLFSGPVEATVVEDIPNLAASRSTWIQDQADILSLVTEGSINKTFRQVAQKTGIEVKVVTLRGLNYGQTPTGFAQDLQTAWFATTGGQDNQVLLVFDLKTNGSAILVGDQAQPKLAQDIAQSIATDSLLIPIRKGNYNEAFVGMSNRLAAVLRGQPDPGPPTEEAANLPESNFPTAEETNDFGSSILVIILLIVATAVPMVTYFYYQRT